MESDAECVCKSHGSASANKALSDAMAETLARTAARNPTPASVVETHRPEVPKCDLADEIGKLLRLRPDLELVIYDNDGVNFGVRLLDQSAEGPSKCIRRRISFDLPFVIRSFIESIPGEPPCSNESQSGGTVPVAPSAGTTGTPSGESPEPPKTPIDSSCTTNAPVAESVDNPPAQACDGSGGFSSQSYDDRAQGTVGSYRPCPGCPRCKPAKHDDQTADIADAALKFIGDGPGKVLVETWGAQQARRIHLRRALEQCALDGIMRGKAKPDDAAFREKVRELCEWVGEVAIIGSRPRLLAREVLAMMEKPCPKK
jgi:hypothetical protein